MHRSQSKFLSIFILSTATAFVILSNQASRAAIETGPAGHLDSPIPRPAPAPGPHLIWRQLEFPTLPPPRIGFALTLDTSNQKALLFGGHNSTDGYLNDTWWTEGEEWTKLGNSQIPIGRFGASLAYDETRQEAIMYGGVYNSEFLGTTFKWTASGWSQQFLNTSPPPRMDASMAYDAARNETILFGGLYFIEADDYLLDDMWIWDGENWHQSSPPNLPPGRSGAQMVYDRAHQNVILFGGGVLGALLDDTWTWDGMDWIEQHPLHTPPGRANFGMAYDESRQQVIVWGGQIAGGISDEAATDTWAWDGKDWTRLDVYQALPSELAYFGQLVYLPELQSTVLISDLRRKTCTSDVDCTFSEETQVWALTYGYLSYFPMVTSVKQ